VSGYVNSPVSGTTYTLNSTWHGQYQRLSPNPFDVAGDNETLNYNWRGSSLSLSQQIAVQ
jgi:hypothetical protein